MKKPRIPIQVVLADDHAVVRQGLLHILAEAADIRVVGEAEDGAKALELVRRLDPDVLVLDYTIPKVDGPSVVEQVRHDRPDVRILVLTMHANVHYAINILEVGAHGYVVKAATSEELVEAIRSVHSGNGFISPVLIPYLARHLGRRDPKRNGLDSLSPREFQLLRLMGAGGGIQACAKTLHIADSTASTVRSRMMKKLKLGNTAELIRFAIENGIIG